MIQFFKVMLLTLMVAPGAMGESAGTSPAVTLLQVRIGHLDSQSRATWSCQVRSDHPAIAPFLTHLRQAMAIKGRQGLAVAYHIMPQVPSIQIEAMKGDGKVSGAAARPVLIFQDYEQIRYRPDEVLLQLARTLVGICGYQYTAFDLPVGEDALMDEGTPTR